LAAIILQAIAQLKLTFTDVHNIPATLFASWFAIHVDLQQAEAVA
jgi:hypothetical protein